MATPRRLVSVIAAFLLTAVAIAGIGGCSGKNKVTNPAPPANTSTTYTGVATGASTSGMLVVVLGPIGAPSTAFGARATVTATGTFTPSGGSAVTLTGTYDDVAHTFTVSGSSWTFGGSLAATVLSGAFSGPGGATGRFTLAAGSANVTVVLGTFTSTSGGSDGRFNFSITDSTVGGLAATTSGAMIPLNGTYVSGKGAIWIAHPSNPGGALLASGTLEPMTGVASGTYDDQDGNSGTWTGTRQ